MANYSVKTSFKNSNKAQDLANALKNPVYSNNANVRSGAFNLLNPSIAQPGDIRSVSNPVSEDHTKNVSRMDFSGSTNNTNNANNANNSNRDALEKAYLDSLRGAGGGYASEIDLANILNTYTQSANAQKQTISDSAASQRQGLLDSLKRFQSETDEARNRQRRAYNASRADLEGQAFMASRQAARSAAARGLGGSGLQQLAQLQALMNQGDAVNQLAQSNTDTLKAIATAAQNKEEDTNKALQNLDKETANKLAQIDANTANLQAQLQYNEAVRLEDAKARAAQAAAAGNSALAQYNLYKLQQEDERQALENAAKTTLENIKSAGSRAVENAYATNQKNYSKPTDKTTKTAIDNAATLYVQMLLESANAGGADINPYLDYIYDDAYRLRNKNRKY